MAGLAPLARPDGSIQVLRYRSTVATGGVNAAVYPKVPGLIPADSAIAGPNFIAYIRLPLFDATNGVVNVSDLTRRFPQFVFDDAQLLGAAPHTPVACVASGTPGINASDLSLNRFTWAQNTDITVRLQGPPAISVDSATSSNNDWQNGAQIVRDTLTSGMGLNTGLPVLILTCLVANADGALQSFFLDVTVEIRHTIHR